MDRGCHNLKRFDPHDGTVRLYPVPGPITAILEKAPEWMWIGTGMGLYLLDGHGDLQTYRISSRGGSCLCTVPGTGRAPVYRHRRGGTSRL